jgi:hypothetical protein
LVTSVATDAWAQAALVRALEEVADDPGLAEVRAALLLEGFEAVALEAYGVVKEMERMAERLGYPVLR